MSLILIERIANLNGPIIPDTLNGVLNGSEIDAHKFIITATRDGATVALTGTVTASFLRADGAEVMLTGEIENGAATVTLAQSCYAVPGRFDLTIFVTADGVKTGVYACTGGVRNTTSGTIVDPGQIVPSVDDIIAKQEELAQDVADASSAIASAQNAVSYLAPVFSTSQTYAVGEYVTKDGALYICTTAVETAGAWDAANWQSVTFGVEVSGLKSALDEFEDGFHDAISTKIDKNGTGQVKPQNIEGVTVTGGNILDDAERIYCSQPGHAGGDGYVTISDSKAIIQDTSPFCSFLVAVKPNTHYTANNEIRFAVLLKNLATEGTAPVKYTTVVGSALVNISSFDTGEADHIIVSWNYSTYPINTFIISEGNTASADIHVSLPDWWTGGTEAVKPKYISTTGSLSDGTFLALMGYKQNLLKGERYVFSGDLTTMSELRFGFTYLNVFSASATIYNEFAIDNTYITYKRDGSSTSYTNRYEHGLTFANNLQFIFEYLPEGNAKITLISNGIMFTQTLPFVKQTLSQVVVLSVGSTLINCKLTWTPIDIDKTIWMFGDSYFAYSSARWTYYMQQYGYAENVLLDGWPGEGSVNARNSLLTLIQFGTPKYIVWCMGMNDGSDTDANTPSTNWVTWRDEMLTICNENGITPIFATIPNVPSVLNTGKNAWIKASGYRYIDFAAAVGAESAGSTWYSGMLEANSDPSKRVHPTETGAKALFARALVDFPELMLNE